MNRKDFKDAVKWLQLSASQGHPPAQTNLSTLYYNGQGVPRDRVRAHMWLILAAAQGEPNALKFRDDRVAKLSAQQIAEAEKQARECEQRKLKGCG